MKSSTKGNNPPKAINTLFVCSITCLLAITCSILYAQQPSQIAENSSQQLQDEAPITPHKESEVSQPAKAAVVIIEGMIDDGLFESIKRRTEAAIEDGATHIIYQMDTFGGALMSAISIWDYLIHDVAPRAHTIAYVPSKAISAGVMISIACNDIVMKRSTIMGDCAPISSTGQAIEGVEREKIESPTRTYFRSAAEANGYPIALCEAFVTIGDKVYQIRNLQTGKDEYFEAANLPTDPCSYDLDNKTLIVDDDELLTVTAGEALQLGLSRATLDEPVGSYTELLAFFEGRDNIVFSEMPMVMSTNWSEELVRFLTSPIVAGILTLIALLGIYAELNSPGLGLPGGIAVAALAMLFGSKFLIGLANWWEIAFFVIGIILLLVEIFVIPGFGIAGISGIIMVLFALTAMMVPNSPGELPIPRTPLDWDYFGDQALYTMLGIFGFVVCAYFLAKHFQKIPIANRLVLAKTPESPATRTGQNPQPSPGQCSLQVGEIGTSLSELRPTGKAKFGKKRFDVVTRGGLVEANRQIKVVALDGNSIVVKEVP